MNLYQIRAILAYPPHVDHIRSVETLETIRHVLVFQRIQAVHLTVDQNVLYILIALVIEHVLVPNV